MSSVTARETGHASTILAELDPTLGDNMTLPRQPGTTAVWRSIHDGYVGCTIPAVVVCDDEDAIALYQPPGVTCKVRTGRRGGPTGRLMLPDGWDGGYRDRHWIGSSVRVHFLKPGYSIVRGWDAERAQFSGWYVNLELPWRRSRIGYDTRDLILDVTIAEDRSSWSWKDEDELAWSRQQESWTTSSFTPRGSRVIGQYRT